MDLLLILTYTAICIAVFKIFRIPLNKWTVPTAVLGGAVLIGTLIFVMNYNYPYSELSRGYFVTTPIVPAVSGTVIEHEPRPNQMLQAGDVLFKIDPEPFQYKVDSLQARLISAAADKSRAESLFAKRVGNQRDVDQTTANYDSLIAQLNDAQYDLDHTVVRAPTAGFVIQDFLRPGMRAVSMPLRPVMIFVHEDEAAYTAWFRQNSMLRLKVGYEAEIAFDGIPGEVFTGVVEMVSPALSEGQLQPTGNMLNVSTAMYPGRIPVMIKITDPRFEQYRGQLPGGAYGQAAIHLHRIRPSRGRDAPNFTAHVLVDELPVSVPLSGYKVTI